MLTRKLAEFIVATRFEDLPRQAVAAAKMHILDCLGVTLAGSKEPVGRMITRHVRKLGGTPEASVLAAGFKTSAPNAALANGTMGHALDFDDDSDTIYSHPSITLLPPILALGENSAAGEEVLVAYVVGEEVAARIASLPGVMPRHYDLGWHATSTLGVIGAAAAGARMLGLDVRSTCMALGIAASEASGLIANFGTMAKPLHAGSAAQKGVAAALLAQAGFTASDVALDGPRGFLSLYTARDAFDLQAGMPSWDRDLDIVSPGINIKKYPCCYYTHAAIETLLELKTEHGFGPSDIRHIRCGLSPVAVRVLNARQPRSGLEAKFNLPFCLAMALLSGKLGIDDFEDSHLYSQAVRHEMEKTSTYVHSGLVGPAAERAVAMEIETVNGGSISRTRMEPSGGGDSPLSWAAVAAKFRACSQDILSRAHQDRIEADIQELDRIPNLKTTVRLLGGKAD